MHATCASVPKDRLMLVKSSGLSPAFEKQMLRTCFRRLAFNQLQRNAGQLGYLK